MMTIETWIKISDSRTSIIVNTRVGDTYCYNIGLGIG